MAETVGEQLKQARTERGLTLDAVEKNTRIRRHYLEALERDDRDALPSRVQGKGFLRLYADYLNLRTDELLAVWEGKPFEEPAVVESAVKAQPEPVAAPKAARARPAAKTTQAAPPIAETVETEAPVDAPVDEVTEVEDEIPLPAAPPLESQAIFHEIGHSLRKQRESLSLSLPEVERYTRLRQHYLRCMESGRLEELPSMVQGRGMLSNYASFLNLDSEEILLQYAEGLQQRRLERMQPPKTGLFNGQRGARGARQASAARRLVTPDLLIGGGLILVLFVFVIWTAARINAIRGGVPEATLPSVGEVLRLTPSATLDLTAAQPGAAGEPSDVTPTPGQPLGQSAPETGPTATLAALNTDPLQVYVVARQRAFLRVVADGVIKFNGRVVPGNAYPFSGTETIDLLSGNAAAFQIFFNQTDLGALGRPGEVLNMTISQAGVVTPTPLPTATSIPTEQITATPGPSPTVLTPTVTPLIP